MGTIKLLQTSDFHARDKDIDEVKACLDFIYKTAKEESVDLAVICGDIFDSQDIKLDSLSAKVVIKFVSDLADICPIAIITGTSSHDGKAPEILSYVRGRYPVHVASKPEQIEMAGAVLSLVPQVTKQFFQGSDQEVSAAMSAIFAGIGATAEGKGPHILVYHGGITGAALSTGQTLTGEDIEVSVDQMMLANPDLICLGHIHKMQVIGERGCYSGSIYRNNWGELEPKGFLIHENYPENGRIWESRFIETPCKKMIRHSFDFTNGQVDGDIPASEVSGAFVRLDYKIFQDEAGKIDKAGLVEQLLGMGALEVDVRIIRVPRETVRAESVLKADRLRDKLVAMAKIKGEEISEGILRKADALEDQQEEELINGAGNGRIAA
jgi:DNA repair exonuclease SbcCD nuclease subunit